MVDCVRLSGGGVDRIEVDRTCQLGEFAILGAEVSGGAVHVEAVLTAARSSVVASGSVTGTWVAECRRCLEEVRGPVEAVLNEVFEWDPTEGETWPISDHRIDLAPAVTEAALLALPLAPLCSQDCAGPVPDRFPTGPAVTAGPPSASE